MKDKLKPLTLGVIKEIVKKVDGLVPDDTPVFMDDHWDGDRQAVSKFKENGGKDDFYVADGSGEAG